MLTYFVNKIRDGERVTPYSTVAALQSPMTVGLADDEIILNSWLGEDLSAKVGDTVALKYFVIVPRSGFGGAFRELPGIAVVVPLAGAAAELDLMPKYPAA